MMKQVSCRPFAGVIERLSAAGLRPTRQRMALARLLFEGSHRHLTAEMLHAEALEERISVSLATIYNTLHQFTAAGLLREVVVESGCSYFDTNTTPHHHFFRADTRELSDTPCSYLPEVPLPTPPPGSAELM
jgi:Fur family iron response transcriptional regulator